LARLAPDTHSKRLAAYLRAEIHARGAAPGSFFADLIVDAIDDVLALYRLSGDIGALRGAAATTLGSVIEQRVMAALSLAPGSRLDASALGRDLELKWSARQRYEIRPSQIGQHCLFLGTLDGRFHVGVFRADLSRAGVQLLGELNGDNKRAFRPGPVGGRGPDRGHAVAWLVRDRLLSAACEDCPAAKA
jgi:hypothetical protein